LIRQRRLGLVDYLETWQAMQHYTDSRSSETEDQLWLLQHPPAFTQGQSGRAEHILSPGNIPVVQSDRGGQVTYHGPGQWVVYLLYDLRRCGQGVRWLVDALEETVVDLLAGYGVVAESRRDAPGVYVQGAKIASLGLRVRRGCSYHGLSLNVDMDLAPFQCINPCGFEGLTVTQVADCLPADRCPTMDAVGDDLLALLADRLAT
jgi:lipoyl(octanoyl) transferase